MRPLSKAVTRSCIHVPDQSQEKSTRRLEKRQAIMRRLNEEIQKDVERYKQRSGSWLKNQ